MILFSCLPLQKVWTFMIATWQSSEFCLVTCYFLSKDMFLPELKTQRTSLWVLLLVVHCLSPGCINCTGRDCLTSNAKPNNVVSSHAPWARLIDPVSCKSFCLLLSLPNYNHLACLDRASGSAFSSPVVTCFCIPEEVGKNMIHAATSYLKTIAWHLNSRKYILKITALA